MISYNELDSLPHLSLDYATSKSEVLFLCKLTNEELSIFKKDSRSSVTFVQMADGYLKIELAMVAILNGTSLTMEIQPKNNNAQKHAQRVKELSSLWTTNTLKVLFISPSDSIEITYPLCEGDFKNFEAWATNTKVITPTLQSKFQPIPIGRLIPNRVGVRFWFLLKLPEAHYRTIKKNPSKAIFNIGKVEDIYIFSVIHPDVDDFVGYLPLTYTQGNPYGLFINDNVISDFEALEPFGVITILVNYNECRDDAIITLNLPIDSLSKSTLRNLLSETN